jgi:hypothetical protein
MPNFALRSALAVLTAIFATAGLDHLHAAMQAKGAAAVQVPAAPEGGIDASKMPDIVGVHLGMSPQEVLAKLKPLYPVTHIGDLGLNLGYAKFGHAPGSPWIQTINGHADPCGNNQCSDVMNVVFNGPPNKQGVIGIDRAMGFPQGKNPTPDTVKAALLQKYGPNPVMVQPTMLGWVFDEQGRPMTPANAKSLVQCAGTVTSGAAGGPTPTNAAPEYGLTGTRPLTPADVADLMRNPCRVGVYVLASLNVAGQVVNSFSVKISENSEATRDVIAQQQYLDGVASGQQQQQLKKAQQQTVPKF